MVVSKNRKIKILTWIGAVLMVNVVACAVVLAINFHPQQIGKSENPLDPVPLPDVAKSADRDEYTNEEITTYENKLIKGYEREYGVLSESFLDQVAALDNDTEMSSKDKYLNIYGIGLDNDLKLIDTDALNEYVSYFDAVIHNQIVSQNIPDKQKLYILEQTEQKMSDYTEEINEEALVVQDVYDISMDFIETLELDEEIKDENMLNMQFNKWLIDTDIQCNQSIFFDDFFNSDIIEHGDLWEYSAQNTTFLSSIIDVDGQELNPVVGEQTEVISNSAQLTPVNFDTTISTPIFNLLSKFVSIDADTLSFEISFIAQDLDNHDILTCEPTVADDETGAEKVKTFSFTLLPSAKLDQVSTKTMFETNYLDDNNEPLNWNVNADFDYSELDKYKFNSYSFNSRANDKSIYIVNDLTYKDMYFSFFKSQPHLHTYQAIFGSDEHNNYDTDAFYFDNTISLYFGSSFFLTNIEYKFDLNEVFFNDLISGEFSAYDLVESNMIKNLQVKFHVRTEKTWEKKDYHAIGGWSGGGPNIKMEYWDSGFVPFSDIDSPIKFKVMNSGTKYSGNYRDNRGSTGDINLQINNFWDNLYFDINKTTNNLDVNTKFLDDKINYRINGDDFNEQKVIDFNNIKKTDSKFDPYKSLQKPFYELQAGSIIDLADMPDLIHFNNEPYDAKVMEGYGISVQILEKIEPLWNNIASPEHSSQFILKYRLIIQNKAYSELPDALDRRYSTRIFVSDINPSSKDIEIIKAFWKKKLLKNFNDAIYAIETLIPDQNLLKDYLHKKLLYTISYTTISGLSILYEVICIWNLTWNPWGYVELGLSIWSIICTSLELIDRWFAYSELEKSIQTFNDVKTSDEFKNLHDEFMHANNVVVNAIGNVGNPGDGWVAFGVGAIQKLSDTFFGLVRGLSMGKVGGSKLIKAIMISKKSPQILKDAVKNTKNLFKTGKASLVIGGFFLAFAMWGDEMLGWIFNNQWSDIGNRFENKYKNSIQNDMDEFLEIA